MTDVESARAVCPRCGAALHVPPGSAGRRVKCWPCAGGGALAFRLSAGAAAVGLATALFFVLGQHARSEAKAPPERAAAAEAVQGKKAERPGKPARAGGKIALVYLTPGWATFGQVVPQGEAKEALRVGDLPTQTDVKTRWPDGSICFAVLTCNAPAKGYYVVTTAGANEGAFTPSPPRAVVKLAIAGTTYEAALPAEASKDLWLSGPLVREYRCVVTPAAGETKHPFLSVVFDVRCYKDRQARVDVAVENCRDVSAARKVVYSVDVSVNNKPVYRHVAVAHHYLTRWRKVFGAGLNESSVTVDFAAAQRARALPRYLPLVKRQVQYPTGPKFDILKPGSLNPYMPTTGGRPEIAPYPDWAATYIAHGDPAQRAYVLAHGDLAGSWPIHLREKDGSFVSIDKRPKLLAMPDSRARGMGFEQPAGDLSKDSLGPLIPDTSHTPSLAFVPYLITGDRYYADEMTFWGAWGVAANFPHVRNFREGLIYPGQQTRTVAWQLRNLADPAAYLPDGHPMKDYFAAKVKNNLAWLDKMAESHPTPLNSSFETVRLPEPQVSLFMNAYVSWAIDHMKDRGFTGGQKEGDRISRFFLQLFTSSPDYPLACSYAYMLKVGTWKGKDRKEINYYTTMKQLFEVNFPKRPAVATSYYYSTTYRFPLAHAVRLGLPRARAAFDYNEKKAAQYLPSMPGWAIRLP